MLKELQADVELLFAAKDRADVPQEIRDAYYRLCIAFRPGYWPHVCEHRAFVAGAEWWQFYGHGSTMFPFERDQAEEEAVKRYGELSNASDAT